MKKTLILTITILTLAFYTFGEVKIGVINAQKVIASTKRGKEIQAKLENYGKSKQKKVEVMQAEIKKLEASLQSPALNESTREKKTLELQTKKTNLKRYYEDTQKELRRKYQTEMQTLQKEVMPIIDKIGKSKGFTLVFDLSIAGISYFDKTIDITEIVIKEIDSIYKTK
ncbi:MAG: OmpH family outer membrane protein [Acidobacteriota bacterium]